mmetsp:Transcript_14354/g.47642  ORF Transcript_14354/g.47642 Transcript_14354/m.47642 type:complete len:215 (+) Transcript_14354:4625-5269(+)
MMVRAIWSERPERVSSIHMQDLDWGGHLKNLSFGERLKVVPLASVDPARHPQHYTFPLLFLRTLHTAIPLTIQTFGLQLLNLVAPQFQFRRDARERIIQFIQLFFSLVQFFRRRYHLRLRLLSPRFRFHKHKFRPYFRPSQTTFQREPMFVGFRNTREQVALRASSPRLHRVPQRIQQFRFLLHERLGFDQHIVLVERGFGFRDSLAVHRLEFL